MQFYVFSPRQSNYPSNFSSLWQLPYDEIVTIVWPVMYYYRSLFWCFVSLGCKYVVQHRCIYLYNNSDLELFDNFCHLQHQIHFCICGIFFVWDMIFSLLLLGESFQFFGNQLSQLSLRSLQNVFIESSHL